MKVVLFCGGYGMRMRTAESDIIPKPLQMVGPRPLLWHVMRYYAHYGHKDFILCLGYGADEIKDFFLNYRETDSNDFVLHDGQIELLGSDISDWTVTFVDTGLESPIGERLRRVRTYLGDDPYFLANYADVLTDTALDDIIDRAVSAGATASMLIVPPQSTFHCVDVASTGEVKEIVQRIPDWSERRILRTEPGGHRPHPREWRPGRRHVHVAGRDGSAHRLPARRILEASRHLQGAC